MLVIQALLPDTIEMFLTSNDFLCINWKALPKTKVMNTPAIEPWLDQSAAPPSSSMHIEMLLHVCKHVKGSKQTKP